MGEGRAAAASEETGPPAAVESPGPETPSGCRPQRPGPGIRGPRITGRHLPGVRSSSPLALNLK